ncbi:MAG: TonB-dependent receptor plug domain-containing protein, partial [Petrimonas mucosa]
MILPGGISSLFAQQEGGRRITGIVTDENNEPLVGATILVPGTTIGTTAGINGEYSLTLPAGSTGIQVSFIGYETQVISTDGREQINIQLQPESFTLDNLVVIGYGTQRKSDLTGSVSNVSSKDFNMGLIGSPEQLINGKVSGVQIMSNSGSPTAGSTIRIRGGASLNASNDPLIVLDGVPLENGGISGNSENFLSLINPSDVESMTILKDASSTAIYGSRASNGVII